MTDEPVKISMWRKVLAFIFDMVTTFGGFGYLVARFSGGLTENGFQLNGMPALLVFALIIGYFVGARYVGGTIWQRIFRAR